MATADNGWSGDPPPTDWTDSKVVEAWLKKQPREWSVAIAARAALRGVPALAPVLRSEPQRALSTIILPVFRGTAIGVVAATAPTTPIERAARGGVGRRGGRPPFAALEHPGLVMLGDGPLAALAKILRRLPPAFFPAEPLEFLPLHRVVTRTRYEEAPLVRHLELVLDTRQPPDRRCRDQQHLAPAREGQRSSLYQADWTAFRIGRGGIGVDLVEGLGCLHPKNGEVLL